MPDHPNAKDTDFENGTLARREQLKLTSEGAAVFVEAITNPPEPNENLRALAREAREIPWR